MCCKPTVVADRSHQCQNSAQILCKAEIILTYERGGGHTKTFLPLRCLIRANNAWPFVRPCGECVSGCECLSSHWSWCTSIFWPISRPTVTSHHRAQHARGCSRRGQAPVQREQSVLYRQCLFGRTQGCWHLDTHAYPVLPFASAPKHTQRNSNPELIYIVGHRCTSCAMAPHIAGCKHRCTACEKASAVIRLVPRLVWKDNLSAERFCATCAHCNHAECQTNTWQSRNHGSPGSAGQDDSAQW